MRSCLGQTPGGRVSMCRILAGASALSRCLGTGEGEKRERFSGGGAPQMCSVRAHGPSMLRCAASVHTALPRKPAASSSPFRCVLTDSRLSPLSQHVSGEDHRVPVVQVVRHCPAEHGYRPCGLSSSPRTLTVCQKRGIFSEHGAGTHWNEMSRK